jgi:hypothetical protein
MKHFIFFVFALALTFAFSSCEKDASTFEPIDDIVVPEPDPVVPSDFIVETKVKPNSVRELSFDLKDAGYMPTFIDGFVHRAGNSTQQYNETLFNIVFSENSESLKWQMFTGLSEQSLLNHFSNYLADGYRTQHLESYIEDGSVAYAVIFVEGASSDQYYVIGKEQSSYQNVFDTKVGQGYRLVNRSVIHTEEEKLVTALFDKKAINDWQAFSNLDAGGVQAKMEQNNQAGRVATYLDISQVNTTTNVLYNPIFAKVPHEKWYALNKLSQEELKDELEKAKDNGYEVTFICGYDKAGLINGNEVNFLQYAVGFIQ